MKTKFQHQHLNFLLGVSLFVLSGFIPEKLSPEFKAAKKRIDTLTIICPIVQVVSSDNRTKSIDSDLTQINKRLIDSSTNKLLSKKYVIQKALSPKEDIELYSEVLQQLENSSSALVNVSSKSIFDKQNTFCQSRYALLLIYYGQFHPDFPPHYKLYNAVLSSRIIITPTNPIGSISDLRVIVIDTKVEQIVYYDRLKTSKYDARNESEVIQMTKDILKNIYYK